MTIRPVRQAFFCALFAALSSAVHADDGFDAVLGGFDDLDQFDEVQSDEAVVDPYAWDLGGSLGFSAAYNLIDHASSAGTDYSGVSRARFRLNLSLSRRFNDQWRLQLSGYGWHDAVYRFQSATYTQRVEDLYETDAEIQEAFVQGKLGRHWDLTLGRQVLVWGFADTLRVLDTLNPLESIEPGIAELEDLRRPTGMLRVNAYPGAWTVGLIAIPEQRFSRRAPFGSDFYALADADGNAIEFREEQADDFETFNAALSAVGRFSGWDLSLNLARLSFDEPYLDPTGFDASDPGATQDDFRRAAVLRHSRVNFGGFGLQFTSGSWLYKQEAAYVQGLDLTRTSAVGALAGLGDTDMAPIADLGSGLPVVGGVVGGLVDSSAVPTGLSQHDQASLLLGVEYYGWVDTTVAIEIAARRITAFDDALAASGYIEDRNESSLRISRSFLREKLRATLVLIGFDQGYRFGERGGSISRINVDYELGPALELSGGLALYGNGRQRPFDLWKDNDRLFASVKWSF